MIRCLKTFDVGTKPRQARSVELMIGDEAFVLLCVSENPLLDPWPESFGYIDHPLALMLFDKDGNKRWKRVFGRGTVPGIWFSPFIAFDLDGDGTDEIYFVHNTDDDHPFSQFNTVLEKIDPRNGETVECYPFPAQNTVLEKMSYAFRHNLSAGYVDGEAVLVTAQGAYTNMYLQAYTKGMKPLWERVIAKDEKGSRASHHICVYDYNGDGVDEMFYGERMISLADGHDVACFGADTFSGHSDVVLPFYDDEDNYYVYTCRENGSYVGCDRVVTFDADGNVVWRALTATDEGPQNHIHYGWLATVKPDYRRIVMACNLGAGNKHTVADIYTFDALTGAPTDFPFPQPLSRIIPIDVNGDGYHEFFGDGKIYDCEGKVLIDLGEDAVAVKHTKMLGLSGEQILIRRKGESVIELWGDDEAVESERFCKRHSRGFHSHMNKLTGAGYNSMATVSTAM